MEQFLKTATERDKAQLMETLDRVQMKENAAQYNTTVQRCFEFCVNSFKQPTLDNNENKCMNNCANKHMDLALRTAMRFSTLWIHLCPRFSCFCFRRNAL